MQASHPEKTGGPKFAASVALCKQQVDASFPPRKDRWTKVRGKRCAGQATGREFQRQIAQWIGEFMCLFIESTFSNYHRWSATGFRYESGLVEKLLECCFFPITLWATALLALSSNVFVRQVAAVV
jgi:hypothetical protein